LCVVSGTTSDPGRPRAGPGRSPESRTLGRATRAGVPALQLAAGRTYDEPTPQPTPHLEGLVIRRYQEAALKQVGRVEFEAGQGLQEPVGDTVQEVQDDWNGDGGSPGHHLVGDVLGGCL